MTVQPTRDHDFHAFGEYAWCPDCVAAKAEQREIDDAANVAEITHLVGLVTDNVDEAERAIAKAKDAITALVSDRVYDIELVEGTGGTDILIEFATIECSLRHVRRIITPRADMLRADRQTDAQALDRIQHWLRDPEWGCGMLEDIADVVRKTGRSTDNLPGDEPTWERH